MAEPPEVIESYSNFKPPFGIRKLIHAALRSVPSNYLRGIRTIVLRDTAGMSRRERQVRWSRRRKSGIDEVLGRYHPESPGNQPWIEILVDNIWESLAPWERRVPMLRNCAYASTLFHEIGHHIHFSQRPEHRDKEDVAKRWQGKLTGKFILNRYWYVIPVLLPPYVLWKLGGDLMRLGRWLKRQVELSKGD